MNSHRNCLGGRFFNLLLFTLTELLQNITEVQMALRTQLIARAQSENNNCISREELDDTKNILCE